MGESTEIAWCDATFNPWLNCTPVGPGCDNCYAERFWRLHGLKPGQDQPRKQTSDKYWKEPTKWNADAIEAGQRRRVFAGSLCDVFDNRAPEGSRDKLWDLISDTPNLDWLLLTKRAPNIGKYLPYIVISGMQQQPPYFDNVWLGVTVENRKHGLPRIDILRGIPARVRFLSIEPLLEDLGELDLTGISWVIVGGESGPNARPMKYEWAASIRKQCLIQRVPYFFKQLSQADEPKLFRHPNAFPVGISGRQFPEGL